MAAKISTKWRAKTLIGYKSAIYYGSQSLTLAATNFSGWEPLMLVSDNIYYNYCY